MIYLDSNGTTPLCNGAKSSMISAMEKTLGNPSSQHWAGRISASIIEEARHNLTKLLKG